MDPTAFADLADQVFRALPGEIMQFVDNVVVLVEPWPDADTLRSLGMEQHMELLGLYEGVPLSERGTEVWGTLPDRIILYQRPIEDEAYQRGQPLSEVIRDTLLHEIGHHLGLEEDELLRLEQQQDDTP